MPRVEMGSMQSIGTHGVHLNAHFAGKDTKNIHTPRPVVTKNHLHPLVFPSSVAKSTHPISNYWRLSTMVSIAFMSSALMIMFLSASANGAK